MLRYIQQIAVPEIGAEGQQKLRNAKVLVIGAGGLGTPVAVYLAAAGVGVIGIMDGDKVSVSNLSRQFMYLESDKGKLKAGLLRARLKAQNPAVHIDTIPEMLYADNAASYIGKYDIVCDCTDNAAARTLIDKTCGELKKPLVYAAVRGWEGYLTVLHHTKGISLDKIFSQELMLDPDIINCSAAGIVNATCGIAGSLQAAEVIKIITGLPSKLDGGILTFTIADPVFRLFELK
jgi:molybdopterin/thiamine biosynthesis adenylyltransferase